MEWDERRPTAVGRPVGATEIRIVDDDGRDVAPGSTGEIWLRRSDAPPRGYYADPDATAMTFGADAGCTRAMSATSTPRATST